MKRKNIFQCLPRRLFLHRQRNKAGMVGKRILAAILLITLTMAACCGCLGNTETKQHRQQKIENICQTIGEDADAYFTELSESACGIRPERIYYSISEETLSEETLSEENYSEENYSGETPVWQEMLEEGTPRLVVGLHKKPEARTDEDYYTEQDIRKVLTETIDRGIIVNIYFDNEHLIYKIEPGGKITVEEIEGADGGAYRNRYEYRIEE